MAAQEEQDEGVVPARVFSRVRLGTGVRHGPLAGGDRLAAPPGELAPHVVGEAARGDPDEPAPGVVGYALFRPLPRRRDERLLNRVLGGGEVGEAPGHRAEHPRRQLPEQSRGAGLEERRGHTSAGGALMTWRTSIGMFSGPPSGPGAEEARAAIA